MEAIVIKKFKNYLPFNEEKSTKDCTCILIAEANQMEITKLTAFKNN
jgi:hypothetical protein